MKTKSSTIGAVSTFIERIMDFSFGNTSPTAFRGHKNDTWKAIPSIFRDEYVEAYNNENSMFVILFRLILPSLSQTKLCLIDSLECNIIHCPRDCWM